MPATAAELPRTAVSPIPPDALGGGNPSCTALDDLQAKLNALQMGDTLSVEAGHVFDAPARPGEGAEWGFLLPQRAGANWICIRSSAYVSLPPVGTRLDPVAHAAFLARIQCSTVGAALTGLDGAPGNPPCQGIRLIGLELFNNPTFNSSVVGQNDTVLLGEVLPNGFVNGATRAVYAVYGGGYSISTRYSVERCWIHGSGWNARGGGSSQNHQVKGVYLHGWDIRLCDSVIEGYQSDGDDASAIGSKTGGTHLIENNYIAATGQGIFYGGGAMDYAGPGWPNGAIVIPSDIVIRRNVIEKLDKWDINKPAYDPTHGWLVKPTLELKVGLRVLIEGNHLHNSFGWPAFTYDAVDPQDWQYHAGHPPGVQTIEDVTTRYNLVTDSVGFMQFWTGSNPIKRVTVHDNLGLNIRRNFKHPADPSNAPGTALYILNDWGIEDLWYEHNTVLGDKDAVDMVNDSGSLIVRFVLKNNILGYGDEGISCRSRHNGIHASDVFLDEVMSGRDWTANALVKGPIWNGNTDPYVSYSGYSPPVNAAGEFFLPGTPAGAGINWTTGELLTGSSLKVGGAYQAGDSSDNGVNFIKLNAGLAGIQAQFTWQQTAGTLEIVFAGSLVGETATGYSYKFGDSTTSTAQNPSHTYAAAGQYTVEFHASVSTTDYVTTALVTVVAPGVPPTVTITSPTANPTFATSWPSLALAGSASDDTAVASVTWSNDRGGSGTATGLTSWSVAMVTLQDGVNVITVTATDTQGNHTHAILTVTYSAPPGPTLKRTPLGATSRTTV